MSTRIGILGFGFIGQHFYERLLRGREPGLAVAFVWNRSVAKLTSVPLGLVQRDLGDIAARQADLVVELAHPSVTYRHGPSILRHADYMITSVTALADEALRRELVETAQTHGRRLFVPHGALVGMDGLWEQRERWAEVSITFRKHPKSLDFSESGIDPAGIVKETVVYDGPARGIAKLFPRNVNTMVTCALVTVGLDACRARLIADPSLDHASSHVVAIGKDGSRIETLNEQPATGVSGQDMLGAMLGTIRRAAGFPPGLCFV
jgi:predicted dinucleotide-utilizing enzyme